MRPGPVRIIGGGNRREGTPAVPRAGRRGLARFALAAATGLAVLAGTMTGTTPAHAAASVSAEATPAAHSRPMFEPCPCTDRLCREVCFQNATSDSPASMIHQRTHLTAARSRPMFDPCLCDNPVCRPLCHQN
jgi:hypothetical protein